MELNSVSFDFDDIDNGVNGHYGSLEPGDYKIEVYTTWY